ncbi:MAG: hypothetical protein JJT94_00265 [Bernardetiaceae bacterium]|nr:hypothetical protein [Bernardetiaceae bacterium]
MRKRVAKKILKNKEQLNYHAAQIKAAEITAARVERRTTAKQSSEN